MPCQVPTSPTCACDGYATQTSTSVPTGCCWTGLDLSKNGNRNGVILSVPQRFQRGDGMTKTKANQAADLYSTARENPYVQRLIDDEELRNNLRDAFEAARGAYGRATGNGKGA